MQKDLVEAPDGGYHEVHISKESTCYIAGIGKCLVTNAPWGRYPEFAYYIVRVIEPKESKNKC